VAFRPQNFTEIFHNFLGLVCGWDRQLGQRAGWHCHDALDKATGPHETGMALEGDQNGPKCDIVLH
jgi:hypothetical protein